MIQFFFFFGGGFQDKIKHFLQYLGLWTFACNVLSLSADRFLPPSLIFNGPAVADRMCYRLAINRIQNKAPGSTVPTGNIAQRPVASTSQVKKLLDKFNTTDFPHLSECAWRKPTCLAGRGERKKQ